MRPVNYYEGCYTSQQKQKRSRLIQQMDKHLRCCSCDDREMRKNKWTDGFSGWCKVCDRMCVEIDKCPKEG